jgi:predicted PurR-regulated permease PerM
MVLFAALLFGVALYAVATWLSERTGLSYGTSVVAWYVSGFLLASGFFLFAGDQLTSQYGELETVLPSALQTLEGRIEGTPIVGTLSSQLEDLRTSMMEDGRQTRGESTEEQSESESQQMTLIRVSMRMLTLFTVWVILAFYVAWDGRRYLQGFLRLFPPDRRNVGRDLATSLSVALPWWLVGRLSSMLVVAALTAPGLLLLGVPLAFVLAMIAGLLSFIPFVGPIASVVPAALVALQSAPSKVFWVLVLYAAVQFVESNIVTPTIQKRVASVPPLLLIGGQLILGTLAGLIGVMFSTPLMLAIMVTIQIVYIRHGLDEEITTPQEART